MLFTPRKLISQHTLQTTVDSWDDQSDRLVGRAPTFLIIFLSAEFYVSNDQTYPQNIPAFRSE
jgi:hypothetical protein